MKYLFWLLAIFTIISCDPGYAYYISNNSEKDIYVYTNPPIKVYDKSINRTKLIDSATINPKETFIIYSNIGGGGGEESFPFNKIRIKKNNDSIVLKNKSEINSRFNQNRKKRLFSTRYTIIVN